MEIHVHGKIEQKLREKHPPVTVQEVEEAWYLHEGNVLLDNREEHQSDPPTVWFISETMSGRLLKVVMVPYEEQGFAILRTAYDPDESEVDFYDERQR